MRRRPIVGAMLAAGLLGLFPCAARASTPASPAPATSVLCQTLHEAVQPALTGLIKNDSLLDEADRAFTSSQSDRMALHSVSDALSNNLNVVARLLGQKFPPDPSSTASASEALMKSRLQAVASAQNDALNVIDAYVQSLELDRPQKESVFTNDRGIPQDFRNAKDPAKPFVDTQIGTPAKLIQIARSQIGALEDNAGIAIMSAVKACSSTAH